MQFLKLCAFLFAFCIHVNCQTKNVAMGNVQTVINGPKLYKTDFKDRVVPKPSALWCEVRTTSSEGKEGRGTIKEASFTRYSDKSSFVADMGQDRHRAYLHFPDKSDAKAAGKYRCDITLDDDTKVHGNMFAFHHVYIDNENFTVEHTSDPLLFSGPTKYAPLDSVAEIKCPVIGYPVPKIVWHKDNSPLELNDRISFNSETFVLTIKNVNESDVGEYRCDASNVFNMTLSGPEQSFEVKYSQRFEIGSDLGWVLPLIVIIIILLLLFIVIFVCQRCQKYKSADYNVEARERGLHSDTTPLKNSV